MQMMEKVAKFFVVKFLCFSIKHDKIYYIKTILNKKTTKESTKFDEKSTNKTESLNNQYSSYIDKYIEHLESEIRQKNRQIDDLTIALKQEQSLNLNSQNILSNTKKNRN